jgi:hypothetical protein
VDADDQAAIAAVRRYAAALERIRTRLLDAYPEFQGVLDLMKAVRSGPPPRLPREGKSPGVAGWWSMAGLQDRHAAKCRLWPANPHMTILLMPGEQTALWALSALLESVLVEPFASNYQELVDQARRRLAERGGA